MTVLAPAAWWRGLGGWTRSGSAGEVLAWVAIASLLVLLQVGMWLLRGVPAPAAE